MRVMRLHEQGPVENAPLQAEELEMPEPGPGQIRVKVGACGLCHTDLHTVEGDLELHRSPVVPGHQVAGTVESVGEGVTRFAVGDRVGVAWLHQACGSCRYCLRGNENLCENALFTGWDVDGGYAEMMLVGADWAYRLPEGLTDVEATPLLCGGIIGYRAFRLTGAGSGSRLGLFGFGNSAHITIQVARHLGCEVYVFTRSPDHGKHAEELGAAWVGEAGDTPPCPLDAAIMFAPAGPLVLPALECLDSGGTLTLAGIYMTPIPEMDYSRHLYREKVVRSVANSTRRDGEELLQLAAEIGITTTTTSYPLEDVNRALLDMKNSAINGDAVLLV